MQNEIIYLKKYNKDVEIIYNGYEKIKEIPRTWKYIFSLSNLSDRINQTIYLWEEYANPLLSNTIKYLKENLINIELIKYKDNYSLLYSINSPDGQIMYYEGGNPINSKLPFKLNEYWSLFPKTIVRFYENLHDGFFYYASRSMGLLSLQDVVFFIDEDWGILDELSKPLKINLETTFGMFASGMGGYVALDILNCDECNATIWFTDQFPEYNVDFWAIVDEWITIGFQE